MPKNEQLWLCMGNGSTPESFGDDFSALADALYEGRVDKELDWLVVEETMPGGFTSGPYQGPVEQVHLYWGGDNDQDFIRNLTIEERARLEVRLEKLFAEDADETEDEE